jgi:hypothetical protein
MYGAVSQLATAALDAASRDIELATLSRGIDVMVGCVRTHRFDDCKRL